jgi:integrase
MRHHRLAIDGAHPSFEASAALNQAVKWGIAATAATRRTSPPPIRVKPKKLPTPQMIEQLISAAEDKGQPVVAAAIAVAATTGVSRGELPGLRWGDIDTERATLHVRRAIKHDDGPGWVIGPPKTHQERTISLDPFTMAVLIAHRARGRDLGPGGFGRPGPRWLRLDVRPYGRRADEARLPRTGFRTALSGREDHGSLASHIAEFSASVLIAAGRDVRTVAGHLGHPDASTALRVYAAMVEWRDREAADFLGQLMSAGQPAALVRG